MVVWFCLFSIVWLTLSNLYGDNNLMSTPYIVDTTNRATFDTGLPEAYDARLYETTVIAEALDGLAAFNDLQVKKYHEQGFLVIENAIDLQVINDTLGAIEDLLDGANTTFESCYFEGWAKDNLEKLTRDERARALRKLMNFCEMDKRSMALAEHQGIKELVTRLIGSPIKLIQDMALMKMPGGREKPWHQDHAYFNVPLESRVIGVWIALDEATLDNGCMRIWPRRHREGPVTHFKRRDWQICDADILDQPVVAVPLKPGGVLLFDSLLPHGTPANNTDQTRRAMQLHFAPTDAIDITDEDRMAVFGSEGKDVTC
jgi:phytanoyl-CoA hydroxylase